MKAKELAALLMEHPDREVVMSKDPEGNGYMPLFAASRAAFVLEDAEVMLEPDQLTDEAREKEDADEDMVAPEGYIPCVCLWPGWERGWPE